eukprot:277371-Pyramimonas_sp.AAC.2
MGKNSHESDKRSPLGHRIRVQGGCEGLQGRYVYTWEGVCPGALVKHVRVDPVHPVHPGLVDGGRARPACFTRWR